MFAHFEEHLSDILPIPCRRRTASKRRGNNVICELSGTLLSAESKTRLKIPSCDARSGHLGCYCFDNIILILIADRVLAVSWRLQILTGGVLFFYFYFSANEVLTVSRLCVPSMVVGGNYLSGISVRYCRSMAALNVAWSGGVMNMLVAPSRRWGSQIHVPRV